MTATHLLKRWALTILPKPLLFQAKKIHYARAIPHFAETDLEVVKALVKPGQHVVDIGANVGWYTYALARLVGAGGRVYSVEPVPATFHLLCVCVRKLGLRNVELINLAISDAEGVASMEIPPYPSGGENFYQARVVAPGAPSRGRQRVEVAQASVDALFARLPHRISFIKCDVEGHELAVARGALRVIRASRPVWLMEVTGDPDLAGSAARTLSEVLSTEGYTAHWFDGHRLRPRQRGDAPVNYFFLTAEHLKDLAASGSDLVTENR